jgi:hypothetical protein
MTELASPGPAPARSREAVLLLHYVVFAVTAVPVSSGTPVAIVLGSHHVISYWWAAAAVAWAAVPFGVMVHARRYLRRRAKLAP